MMQIRRISTVAVAVVALAAASPVLAQRNNEQNRGGSKEQQQQAQQRQREIIAVAGLVDAVAEGKPAPSAIPVSWKGQHFVKGSEGTTYIPFTLNITAGQPKAEGLALYIRAVDKNAPPPAPAPAPAADNKNNNDRNNRNNNDKNKNQQAAAPAPAPKYAWEDFTVIQAPAGGKLQRAIMVKPGEYDIYVAVQERIAGEPKKDAPPAAAGVSKQTLKVPDFNSTTELSISTPIFAAKVEPLTAPLTDQMANPYAFGGTLQVTPADSAVFKTADDLEMLFWIYGSGDKEGIPDLNVEYNFHTKAADGTETFFNKTQPQPINATTLPPGFNIKAGHQVLGYLGVPLKSFPAGEYRVEVTITDKLSGKTLKQNAAFTVQS